MVGLFPKDLMHSSSDQQITFQYSAAVLCKVLLNAQQAVVATKVSLNAQTEAPLSIVWMVENMLVAEILRTTLNKMTWLNVVAEKSK